MNKLSIIFLFVIASCNNLSNEEELPADSIVNSKPDTALHQQLQGDTVAITKKMSSDPKAYANERFKDVRVKRTGDEEFVITGKAQIFEASFSWVLEDAHGEVNQGHEMTDAGAPAWGNFSFTVNTSKANRDGSVRIILFETSAKDGSRQYELPIKLD